MRVSNTGLSDVQLLEPEVHRDERGFLVEYFNVERFGEQGLNIECAQLNHSRSDQGVLRGLHYQLQQPQGKLLQVVHGEVFDVAVDVRTGSPTFGQWVGNVISAANHRQVYIPPGFAHGFCVLSESADVLYLCTDFYRADDEHGIAWDDPELGIDWPGGPFRLSPKDRQWPGLSQTGDVLPCFEG